MKYGQFLAAKRHTSGNYGFDAQWMPECAFDFQRFIIEKALRKGRIGIELKDSYFKQAKINLQLAGSREFDDLSNDQQTLMDTFEAEAA